MNWETVRDITALIALLFLLAPCYGLIRVLPGSEPLLRYFSLGAITIYAATMFRVFYGTFVGPMPDALGSFFHLVYIASTVFVLKSFYLTIPEDKRDQYAWYTAHLYPPLNETLEAYIQWFSFKRRKRK